MTWADGTSKARHMQTSQRYIVRFVLTCFVVIFFLDTANSSTSNSSINISITVPSSSSLTFGTTSLRFIPDDPTLQQSVPALENPVSVLAKTRSKGTPSLTVIASDDLKDGANIIPVSSISWTADAQPYIGGTMNKSTAQAAALFSGSSGTYQSAFRF